MVVSITAVASPSQGVFYYERDGYYAKDDPEHLNASAWTDMKEVRIHDLRNSFASRALAPEESLPMIGKLLGHRRAQTTARYAHLARESVKEAAARIAASIGEDTLCRVAPLYGGAANLPDAGN